VPHKAPTVKVISNREMKFTFHVPTYQHDIEMWVDVPTNTLAFCEKGGKKYHIPVGLVYLTAVKRAVS
jgi:hypothetical protein